MVRPIEDGYVQQQHSHRVHFSPVVSQLRYREQQGFLIPMKSKLGQQKQQVHDNCERVKVHIQEVFLPSPPIVQKVEKIQVPSSSSSSFDRNSVGCDDLVETIPCSMSMEEDSHQESYFLNGSQTTAHSISTHNGFPSQGEDYYKGFFRNVVNQNNSNSVHEERNGTIFPSSMTQGPEVMTRSSRSRISNDTEIVGSVAPKPSLNENFQSHPNCEKNVKKSSFIKSKLNFFHRFAWNRLGGSSNNFRSKSIKVCVPVSNWPFKSVESTDSQSSPVNRSCSACVELCQVKKESVKARNPVAHKVGPRTCYYPPPNVNGNTSSSSSTHNNFPMSSCRRKVDGEEEDDDDEKGFVINTNFTAALKGSKQGDKSLLSRNIPTTGTTESTYHWTRPTAEQNHFVQQTRVRNEEAAVFSRDCPFTQVLPDDNPVVYPNNFIAPTTTTELNYNNVGPVQLAKNCTVATSPIRHLSTFYSLNLPVVSKNRSSVIVDTSPASSSSVPIPKPRRKKATRPNNKITVETTPSSSSSLDTDEFSANVDKILDNVLDEIECFRMEINDKLLLQQSGEKKKETNKENEQPTNLSTNKLGSNNDHHQNIQEDHIRVPRGKPPLPPKVTREQFFSRPESDSQARNSGTGLEVKLLRMQLQLSRSRQELSHPDLEEIEDTVRKNSIVIDRWKSRQQRTLPLRGSKSGNPKEPLGYTTTTYELIPDPVTIENDRCRSQEWSNLYSQVSFLKQVRCPEDSNGCNITSSSSPVDDYSANKPPIVLHRFQSDNNISLMSQKEKENLVAEDRQLSEHELRIKRSLNKLDVPDWYTKYASSNAGGGSGGQSSSASKSKSLAGGWSGLSSSKTSSLTSLQSTGRSHFSRFRTGTASSGARSSRESLMSPSSTASASPSPYYERSSFTYGMPYALSRFASARMSCGASPASLSPSPSPVGGVGISSPVSSAPLSRHHSYSKTAYLGWRSQERLTSKALYRTPAERLAADLLAQKSKPPPTSSSSVTDLPKEAAAVKDTPEICLSTSPKKETASDLSLNNSEESNSHKLNRVRSSIKEVSNAIVDYVNESKPLDDSVNGASPRRGYIWLESSFVGVKPLDSPVTPDTPQVIMSSSSRQKLQDNIGSSSSGSRTVFRFDDEPSRQQREIVGAKRTGAEATNNTSTSSTNNAVANTNNGSSTTTSTFTPYLSRNDPGSPTLEDVLISLLALRHSDQKKIRGHHTREPPILPPSEPPPAQKNFDPVSDWQERFNQPLQDTVYFPITDDFFPPPTTTAIITTTTNYSDSFVAVNSSSSLPNDNDTTTMTTVNNDADFGNFAHAFFSGNNENNEEEIPDIIGPRDVKVSDSTSTGVEFDENELLQRHEEEMLDKEEDAFGNATEIFPTVNSSCNAVNVIASSLNDPSSPTPTRHRRVSFDLDISDKEEKSSSRSRRDESVGGTIHCRNSKCGKTATGLEARREFKTCHNCNAYYCSRECRRADWEKKHKKVCMQSRVGALCKQIINHVKEDSFVVSQLSAVARRGILAKGKGCVKLFFSSPVRAERFLTTVPSGGLLELPEPWYIPMNDILPEEMGAQTFTELSEQCRTYNGDNRFVLYVSVCVVNEVPTSGAVKWEREMISRSAKLRLLIPRNYDESQMHHQAATTAHLFPSSSSSEEQPQVPPHLHLHHQDQSDSAQDKDNPPPLPPHHHHVHSSSDNSDTHNLRSVPDPPPRQ